jgi:CRP-like cAMP-binding protein
MLAVAAHTLAELVVARGRETQLATGQLLFRQGDSSTSVYACVRGRLKAYITTPAGHDLLLGIKHPGQAFGELSAIDGRPRAGSVAAMEPCIVAQMSRDAFLSELRHAPDLALSVLRELSDQLRRSNARAAARDAECLATRAGHMLLELAGQFARHGPQTGHIELPISQSDLASWIGAGREATARALADFRASGLISTGRCKIVVLDLDGLAEAIRAG